LGRKWAVSLVAAGRTQIRGGWEFLFVRGKGKMLRLKYQRGNGTVATRGWEKYSGGLY